MKPRILLFLLLFGWVAVASAASDFPSPHAGGIYFNPIGTGAIARSVEAKLRDFCNARDYGADPTGMLDSQAAFTHALNACVIVYAGPGTFKLTSALQVPENRTLTGARGRNGGNTIFNCTAGVSCLAIENGFGHTTVRDVAVTGGARGAYAISVRRPNTTLDGIHVYDFQGEAGIILTSASSNSGPWDSKLRNIRIQANTAGHPITKIPLKWGVIVGTNSNSVSLEGFTIFHTGAVGTGCLKIEGGSSIRIANGTLEACYVEGQIVYAAHITGGESVTFEDLYIEGNSLGVVSDRVTGLALRRLYIDGLDVQSNGIRVNGPHSVNVTLQDNYVKRIFGTQTDIQLVDSPVNVVAINNKTDDRAIYVNNGARFVNIQDGYITGALYANVPVLTAAAGVQEALSLYNTTNAGSSGDGVSIRLQNTSGDANRAALIEGVSEGTFGQSTGLRFKVNSGTRAPTERMFLRDSGLYITGRLSLASMSEPTCDASTRGLIVFNHGRGAVGDTLRICTNKGSDVYGYMSLF